MIKASVSILTLFIVFGCSSTKNNGTDTNSALRFEKTACFGTCPEFVLEVKNDGSAELSVSRNLELDSGLYSCSNCDELQLQLIIKKAIEIGFNDLEDKYDPGVTDLPSVITTINGKKVVNVLDGPQGLKELENQINDAYINHRTWVKVAK